MTKLHTCASFYLVVAERVGWRGRFSNPMRAEVSLEEAMSIPYSLQCDGETLMIGCFPTYPDYPNTHAHNGLRCSFSIVASNPIPSHRHL